MYNPINSQKKQREKRDCDIGDTGGEKEYIERKLRKRELVLIVPISPGNWI